MRLVHQHLGPTRVESAVGNESVVDVVDAHRASVRTAHAVLSRDVARGRRGVHVLEFLRRLTDIAHEAGGDLRMIAFMLLVLRERWRNRCGDCDGDGGGCKLFCIHPGTP